MPKCHFNKLQSIFIEITLRYECSVNLLHIFRIPSPKNTSEGILLDIVSVNRCARNSQND